MPLIQPMNRSVVFHMAGLQPRDSHSLLCPRPPRLSSCHALSSRPAASPGSARFSQLLKVFSCRISPTKIGGFLKSKNCMVYDGKFY